MVARTYHWGRHSGVPPRRRPLGRPQPTRAPASGRPTDDRPQHPKVGPLVTKPVVLIAEELSPATLDALGPDFEVRHVDGADRAALLSAIADVDAILTNAAGCGSALHEYHLGLRGTPDEARAMLHLKGRGSVNF